MNGRTLLAPVMLIVVVACATNRASSDRVVTDTALALQRYNAFLQAGAADSLAAMYTPDGLIAAAGQPDVVGPAAIAAQLRKFADFHVLSNILHVDSTTVQSMTVRQYGTFAQRVRVPAGDTISAHGRFEATWIKARRASWKLTRFETR